jgi:hypothetical protein
MRISLKSNFLKLNSEQARLQDTPLEIQIAKMPAAGKSMRRNF